MSDTLTDAYVEVTATVHAPWGEATPVPVGSHPAWALPLSPEWKKSRHEVAYDAVGHYHTRGDGWRVTFAIGEPQS